MQRNISSTELPKEHRSLPSPTNIMTSRQPVHSREQLPDARRIVVKIGSAVITHNEGHLSAPRLASIAEQMAQQQKQQRKMLLVTSGSVAFGRKKITEAQKMKPQDTPSASNRAAAAVGQSSLMSFYESLFQQYDCKVAQVLVTKADFQNEHSRKQLRNTITDLLDLDILPIVNTNDAVEAIVTSNIINGKLDFKKADMTDIMVEDNDSLAAILAAELESDLLIMLSNVDGIYSGPPGQKGSQFIATFTPQITSEIDIQYGSKSSCGLGGMEAKVKSALWALRKGTSVVICNGSTNGIINRVLDGERIGTFFTDQVSDVDSSQLAAMSRDGSRALLSIGAQKRSELICEIAQALETNKESILAENDRDLAKAKEEGLEPVLLARLKLNEEKLKNLSDGLVQVAQKSINQLDRTLKLTQVSDSLCLRQITCPIGVLLVLFESRPDCLPQISGLSIATANGLLLKGGKEAYYSNLCLYNIIKNILSTYNCQNAIQLVDSRERVTELANLGDAIDLIIPRGSNQLVKSIQQLAKSTPVLGHSEGICHVYLHEDAEPETAIRIVLDSKCDYPAACNAMETLLIHRSILSRGLFLEICNKLKERNVKLNFGKRLAKEELPVSAPVSNSYRVEYGDLECTIEVVESLNEAINHINEFGSRHTDTIVTLDPAASKQFKMNVDSANVFINCSTRFADGYRYGFGAEVGISTSKIHARGPAGMESLLTYKWILEGRGDVVEDYKVDGTKTYIHQDLQLPQP